MGRSEEFGLGATYIQEDPEGNETEKNAITEMGGTRDQDTSSLPQDRPAPTRRRAGPLGPMTPQDAADWDDEERRSKNE